MPDLVESLLQPGAYPHPVGELRRREHSVSDADLAVLERQLASAELPDEDELAAAGPPDGRDSWR